MERCTGTAPRSAFPFSRHRRTPRGRRRQTAKLGSTRIRDEAHEEFSEAKGTEKRKAIFGK
ncbi:MAG: hypothetical protein BGO63_18770 [Candidatus Accumulibacter sp. 66-26]|nr:hypothetical protein [Accumulibacter sp.]OJW51932.1 MAG: hypothetical protein BGO63_18770 [Candidatus Accumulibacter sp. 66-26]